MRRLSAKEKQTINIFTGILSVVTLILMGMLLFRLIDLAKTSIKPKQVFVNDLLKQCEEKGGKFSIYWSEYQNNYYYNCNVPEKEIKLK